MVPTVTKNLQMFWGVIPDFLEGGKIPVSAGGADAALAHSHTNDLRLPTALRLNAPSGVRWNKWDGRGQWDSRKTEGGGLKGVEMVGEAGSRDRGLHLWGGLLHYWGFKGFMFDF